MRRAILLCSAILVAATTAAPAMAAVDPVAPSVVAEQLEAADSLAPITKTVNVPIDVCFLVDESGSMGPEVGGIKAAAADLQAAVGSENASFAVAGFRDYPQWPFGNNGDYVYRDVDALANLTASGGGDEKEAQYDAIVAALGQCGFSSGALKVLVLVTDDPFHTPGRRKPHQTTASEAADAVSDADVYFIGLWSKYGAGSPYDGTELKALASATGGVALQINSDASNIDAQLAAGLAGLPSVTSDVVGCAPLQVSLTPVSGSSAADEVVFTETISAPADIDLDELSDPQVSTQTCNVVFTAGSWSATQSISVELFDQLVDCTGPGCSASNSDGGTTLNVSSTGGTKGTLGLTIGGSADLGCGGTPVGETFVITPPGNSSSAVAFEWRLAKSEVEAAGPSNSPNDFDLCFDFGDGSFTAPACLKVNGKPALSSNPNKDAYYACVHHRHKNNAGDVILEGLMRDLDPRGRGFS